MPMIDEKFHNKALILSNVLKISSYSLPMFLRGTTIKKRFSLKVVEVKLLKILRKTIKT